MFHEAAGLAGPERPAFLESRCGDDPSLVTDVLALLEEDARGGSMLDRDVAHVALNLLEDAAPRLPAEAFGPYRVTRILGEGGMGVVYLAERADLGSQAALKILRDAWLSPARRERFALEQRTLAQLNHPSIARLYDADTLADGTPWFVMEYVEGEPLTTYCDSRALSIPDRLRLFRAVCEAVQHAHLQAVIHRDLKPSNILVKQDGGVKLLDFGIAKQMESLDAPADRTRTWMRLMTPAYAAPEQVRGDRIGVHTDVYSLGVILYELLAGQLPFDLSDRTPGQVESMIVEQDPERPSAVARRAAASSGAGGSAREAGRSSWADLDVLCLTAMHKDPARRYRSVEALIREIDHYLKGEPLEARPDSVRYRAGKFLKRNRRAVTMAAVVSAVVVGLVVFFTLRLASARNAAVAEAARTQRIQRFMMNLFRGGDEAAGPAGDLRVVTLVDRGVQEARALDAEPAAQAELYETLGTIYQQLGKLDEADELLRSSLDRRRSALGPDHADVAESVVALAQLRSAQARYDEAESLAREGLDLTERALPPDHPAVGRATAVLGQVLEDRGRYEQAISVLEEAVKLQSRPGGVAADLAASLTELANSHFYAGHLEQSEALNRRVLEMERKIYGERHPHVAYDLINLGAVQSEQGRYAEAERFYRDALDIIESFYGKDHEETASALTMLGRALVAQGKLDESGDMLRRALGIQERVYGPDHPRVASVLNEKGLIAVRQGKLDEAQACFTRMAEIYRKVHKGKHYLIGVALANLASVYVERKEYDAAERLYREALDRYAETLSADHPNVGIARIRLGRALLRHRRFVEAETEILAGRDILMKQAAPPARWLKFANEDLVSLYEALDQPAEAAKFRTPAADPSHAAAGATASK